MPAKEPGIHDALRDPLLSFRARGVLAYVFLTTPFHEVVNIDVLDAATDRDGRAAIQAALHELSRAGYRIVHRPGRGIGARVEWTLEPARRLMPPEDRGVDRDSSHE